MIYKYFILSFCRFNFRLPNPVRLCSLSGTNIFITETKTVVTFTIFVISVILHESEERTQVHTIVDRNEGRKVSTDLFIVVVVVVTVVKS